MCDYNSLLTLFCRRDQLSYYYPDTENTIQVSGTITLSHTSGMYQLYQVMITMQRVECSQIGLCIDYRVYCVYRVGGDRVKKKS